MAEIGAALSLELSRIIDCPYPASLAGLDNLLLHTNVATIQACIQNHPPCAVSRLAALVRDALPLWPYTLRVLQQLCHASQFHRELLLQNPNLLDSLLTKAVSSQEEFDELFDLCVLLLSRPLPEEIPLPAAAQTFFLRLFQQSTQDPQVCTLKSIYRMLNGACRQILSILPVDAQQKFDRQLCHILSSNNAGQNSMLLLWCFGIVLLAENPSGIESLLFSQPYLVRPKSDMLKRQWRTSSGQKLFGTTKGSFKTMTLTCMSVVWAAKGRVGVSDEEAVEGIRIASRILHSVDQNARTSWSKSSSLAENTLQKLLEKIKRTGINRAVLFETLSFYATIAGQGDLDQEVVTLYERCLSEITQDSDPECLGETLALSLPTFAPQIREEPIQMLLSSILDACISISSPCQMAIFEVLTESLSSATLACELLRVKAVSSFSSPDFQERLCDFIRSNLMISDASCPTHTVLLHRKLTSATIALLLSLALVVPAGSQTLPSSQVIALINKQRDLSSFKSRCSHDAALPQSVPMWLFQKGSTRQTSPHLQDWKNRLKSEIDSQNACQQDIIMRSVVQICEDLDTRCKTVEEPLRLERERSKELEQLISRLEEQISCLETEKIDDRFHLEGIEYEKEKVSQEKETLSASLRELEQKFEKAKEQEAEALRRIQENLYAKEVELQSKVLCYEESVSARAADLERLNGTLAQLKEDKNEQDENFSSLKEEYEQVQAQLSETEGHLQGERQHTSAQIQALSQLEARCFDLENQLEAMETELMATSRKLGDLEVSHRESVQTSEKTLQEVGVTHQIEMEAAVARVEEDRKILSDQLQSTLKTSQQVKNDCEEAQRDLQLLQASVPPLERTIREFTDLCSEQEEELNELRTLRKNVLASMGLASQNPLPIRSSPQSSSEAMNTRREPREHRRRKSAFQGQEATMNVASVTSSAMNTASGNCADFIASSESNHSDDATILSKRLKPCQTFKVPMMRAPSTQKPGFESNITSRKSSPRKRAALRQISPNRRRTTVGFVQPGDNEHQSSGTLAARKSRGSLGDVEEDLCDIDDFLAGTPCTGNFLMGTGRLLEEDSEDRPTTEF